MSLPLRLSDIPFEETFQAEPPAPPLMDLFGPGPARTAAFRYWVTDVATGSARLGLHATFATLPLDATSAFGARIGPVFRWLNRKTLATARMEAALARIRPDLDTPDKREPVIDAWWRNRVRTLSEFPQIDRLADPARLSYADQASFEAVAATGRPMIVLGIHLSSWEASFRMLMREADRGRRDWVGVYAPQPNRFENRLVHRLRKRGNVYAFPPGAGTAKRLLQLLRSGAANLALLIDEPSEGDIKFPLFGRSLAPRCNLRIAIALARRTDAIILPGYVLRTNGAHFVGAWLPPIEVSDHPKGESGDQEIARALSAHYETLVTENVTQWYMLDRIKFR